MTDDQSVGRRVGLVVAWVAAATLSVLVGVAAVAGLGDQLREEGPVGDNELVRSVGQNNPTPTTPNPEEPRVEKTFAYEFGEFVVACHGKYAVAVDVRPDSRADWRNVSYEPGPDDDVDALFSNGRESLEIEVYCNLGRPVLSELERNTLQGPGDFDDD